MNDSLIKRCIYDTPLALTSLPSDAKKMIDNLMPYDTGIEIECDRRKENLDLTTIASEIPNLKAYSLTGGEQRFRIPGGIDGMICLYHVSLFMKKYFGLNLQSGIHYHTDLTDIYNQNLVDNNLLERVRDFLLSELDTWEYKGTFNRRSVSFDRCWVRFEKWKKTMEVRIGEMTFDYSLLIKRILHCQYLNKYVRKVALGEEMQLEYYQEKLKELNKKEEFNLKEVTQIIKNRVIKI